MGIDQSFRTRVEAFLAITGMAHTRLGILALEDPRFVETLRKGRSPSGKTIDIVDAFMRGYTAKRGQGPRPRRTPKAAGESDAAAPAVGR